MGGESSESRTTERYVNIPDELRHYRYLLILGNLVTNRLLWFLMGHSGQVELWVRYFGYSWLALVSDALLEGYYGYN